MASPQQSPLPRPHPLPAPAAGAGPTPAEAPLARCRSDESLATAVDQPAMAQQADEPHTIAPGGVFEPAVEKRQAIPELDIEHLVVKNDPRAWSDRQKNVVLAIISFSAMNGTITSNIFLPSIAALQSDLHTTDQLIAATVSIFIFFQGFTPLIWSALSEVFGRKYPYLVSNLIFLAGTTACSRAQNIGVFIAMRILQAVGSSAVLAIGAGSLSDIYDTHERGTKLGIYYAIPLLGPSIGPLLGGALSESAASWRATFYFLIAYGLTCTALMIFVLPETFRKERSLAWRRARDVAFAYERAKAEKAASKPASLSDHKDHSHSQGQEKEKVVVSPEEVKFKVGLKDVNPLSATGTVLRQPQNVLAVLFSGCLFAVQYCLAFTATRSFEAPPYSFGALIVGCILLSFGVGNLLGSVLGGRYSDHVFNKMTAKNGGHGAPEYRILSTRVAMLFGPPLVCAYGWLVEKQVPIYGPIIVLCPLGGAIIWIYSSTLAYLVDGNVGRSSSAVACNSFARGLLAAIASQVAEPIIDKIGNGWFYTGMAVILAVGQCSLLLASKRGEQWRERHQEWERRQEEKRNAQ